MRTENKWCFKCKKDMESGDMILENCNGMMAGRITIQSTGNGISLSLINSQNQATLLLETISGRKQHAIVLVPRRAVVDAKDGFAVYGVIDRKTSGFNPLYEYESSTGSEVIRIVAEGFPRHLVAMKDQARIAEIEKKSGEIVVQVSRQITDKELLVIIGIMLAICVLLPTQLTLSPGIILPAILTI